MPASPRPPGSGHASVVARVLVGAVIDPHLWGQRGSETLERWFHVRGQPVSARKTSCVQRLRLGDTESRQLLFQCFECAREDLLDEAAVL